MIRIDTMWLAVEPIDMRAGADRLLARVVQVFGSAQAHHVEMPMMAVRPPRASNRVRLPGVNYLERSTTTILSGAVGR